MRELRRREGGRDIRREGTTKPVTPNTPPHPTPVAAALLTFLLLWLFRDLLPRLPVTERGRGK